MHRMHGWLLHGGRRACMAAGWLWLVLLVWRTRACMVGCMIGAWLQLHHYGAVLAFCSADAKRPNMPPPQNVRCGLWGGEMTPGARNSLVALAFAVMCSSSGAALQQDLANTLTFNNFVADHMVLARAPLAANIWGNATTGSLLIISLDGHRVANTTATADGRWQATLPPQPAGAGHTITVESHNASLEIMDVAFGDVSPAPVIRPL